MSITRSSRRGFTLIEALAAAVLTALLVVALFRVVAAFQRDPTALARPAEIDPAALLLPILQRDLAQTRVAALGSETLILTGPLLLDAIGQPTHLPATVEYQIRQINRRPWLVRTQTGKSDRSLQSARTDLLIPDVTACQLIPAAKLPSTTRPGQSAPTRYQLKLTREGRSSTSEVICQ